MNKLLVLLLLLLICGCWMTSNRVKRYSFDLVVLPTGYTWTVDPGPVQIQKSGFHTYYCWPSTSKEGQQAAVLLLHGLGSYTYFCWLAHASQQQRVHRGLFYEGSVLQQMNRNGMNVYAVDLDGHGLSYSSSHLSLENWVQVIIPGLLKNIRHHHQWHDNRLIHLIGHSTGALILTRVAQKEAVASLLSLAPLYGLHAIPRWLMAISTPLLSLMTGFFGELQISDGKTSSPIHHLSPALLSKAVSLQNMTCRWIYTDQLMDPFFMAPETPVSFFTATEMARQLVKVWKEKTLLLTTPFLIIHSRTDPVVSFKASEAFLNNLRDSPARKELFAPQGAILHNVLLEEPCRNTVSQKIMQWLLQKH